VACTENNQHEADDEEDQQPSHLQSVVSVASSYPNEDLIEVDIYDKVEDLEDSQGELNSNFVRVISIGVMNTKDHVLDNTPNNKEHQTKILKSMLLASTNACECSMASADKKRCLATYVDVRVCEAWALWDSGSTTTGITPVFAQVAKIPVFPLSNPHILQLGMIGSHCLVNYGTKVKVQTPGTNSIIYMDIANFDRYDMIIGTLFMRKNKVHLDFENDRIVINGVATPDTPIELLDTDGHLRWYRTMEKHQS
jgi:Retroviral aspartyl protease